MSESSQEKGPWVVENPIENPLKFEYKDLVGGNTFWGALFYNKDSGKWGFEDMSSTDKNNEEVPAPIEEAEFIPSDAPLTDEFIQSLREIARVAYVAYSVGRVDGKPVIVETERWDQQVNVEVRTADGWKPRYPVK